MNPSRLGLQIALGVVAAGSLGVLAMRAEPTAATAAAKLEGLPAPADAVRLLDASTRHRQWIKVGDGAALTMAFVVYPERSDKAPVVVLTAREGGLVTMDWLRAIGDQLAAHGLLAVVPEVGPTRVSEVVTESRTVERVAAIERVVGALPSSTGEITRLDIDSRAARIDVWRAGARVTAFETDAASWNRLTQELGGRLIVSDPHAEHRRPPVGTQVAAQAPGAAGGRGGGGLANKAPNLVASIWTAPSTVARTTLRHEWVDIPLGDGKLRTWIEYPEGAGPAPVVIVMQHGPGLDDWVRAVADQLASEGFIAVAPDLFSGFGPNGGNYDSFKSPDEAMRVGFSKLTPDEAMRRYLAAYAYAVKLPRASGKIGSIGFCIGGDYSFRFAAEAPTVHAAVVFYGSGPDEAVMAKIQAPVIGFYGEDDARITNTVEATTAAMKKLGKRFEPHVYPGATHAFLLYQVEGRNQPATQDAWPRATAFLKEHLR